MKISTYTTTGCKCDMNDPCYDAFLIYCVDWIVLRKVKRAQYCRDSFMLYFHISITLIFRSQGFLFLYEETLVYLKPQSLNPGF